MSAVIEQMLKAYQVENIYDRKNVTVKSPGGWTPMG